MGYTIRDRTKGRSRSAPISRILCPPLRAQARMTIIPLGPSSLTASSDLPGGFGRAALERLPIWSCSVRGFACHPCCHGRGALLPHLFTLTSVARGGIFSVPLSVRLLCPGVTRRTALRSSDFPPAPALQAFGEAGPKAQSPCTRVRKPAIVWPTATPSIISRCRSFGTA